MIPSLYEILFKGRMSVHMMLYSPTVKFGKKDKRMNHEGRREHEEQFNAYLRGEKVSTLKHS